MTEVSIPLEGLIGIVAASIIVTMILCATIRAIRKQRKKKRDEYEELKTLVYRADEILTGQSHYGFKRQHVENGLEHRVSQIEHGLGVEPPRKQDEGWVW